MGILNWLKKKKDMLEFEGDPYYGPDHGFNPPPTKEDMEKAKPFIEEQIKKKLDSKKWPIGKEKDKYRLDNSSDDGFLTSMVIGYATDSTIEGALLGGNVEGAIIGDMLNTSDNSNDSDDSNNFEFGGGSSDGGGAGGSWDDSSSYSSSDYSSDSDSSSYDSGSSYDSSDSPSSDW